MPQPCSRCGSRFPGSCYVCTPDDESANEEREARVERADMENKREREIED